MHFYIRVEKTAEAMLAVRKSFFKLKLERKKRERKTSLHLAPLRKAQGRTKLFCSVATWLI